MNDAILPTLAAVQWPIRMEFIPGWVVALLFLAGALPIVALGMWSLSGLGPVRKWVAIGMRLCVLLLFLLILGGVRWQRTHKDVEVWVLRDISSSTGHVREFPGKSLQQSMESYLLDLTKGKDKKPSDRIGLVSFGHRPAVDAMPSTDLKLDARALREPGTGTDPASAIQLALATMGRDAMHRMVLVWDGNSTTGDLESAINAANSAGVPIDVMPLKYDVENEVLLERFVAPGWKRENEPFTLEVVLRSTNRQPVIGKLRVMHQDRYLDLDPTTAELDVARQVTLRPGLNVEHVRVPALGAAGVHQFRAIFDGQDLTGTPNAQGVAAGGTGVGAAAAKSDTLAQNNVADAFTFVRGKGKVLYVDNVDDQGGEGSNVLIQALGREGITLEAVNVDQFPRNLVALQSYDAVVLANVPRGAGGLSEDQAKMLASYVHDNGGGLVMIGGTEAFGAGGWQGSRLEEVLPVDMEIPAQRQIGKGALVMVMHSCEMPDGNFWGEQCAIKAVDALSAKDEIGVISYGWRGGGSQWDFPLAEKGDGGRVKAAIKNMQLGDMPSFDDSMNVALNGGNGMKGLKDSTARHKHVIIISDGDPGAPNANLVQQYINAKVSVSTVTVYPHMGGAGPGGALPPTMQLIADQLKGKAYGPINNNPGQLPQIFIKEASIVKRSLIHEEEGGIPIRMNDASSEAVKGFAQVPPVFGMVLTSKKNDPKVVLALAAGKMNDPILAHWQTGLGKAAVFTSDAHNKWASPWVSSPEYGKFWAQVVRSVARPPMSTDFDVQVVQNGDRAKVVVEAVNRDSEFLNFMSITGTVAGPGAGDDERLGKPMRLVQTGPGTYEGEFDVKEAGNYVVALNYRGRANAGEEPSSGLLLTGLSRSTSAELRDLRSNAAKLREIADRTRGRVLPPFDPAAADVFTRDGLKVSASPMPVWDLLIPVLLALILLDVAVRRIAWDWMSTKRLVATAAERVRLYTTARKVESRQTLAALKRVREEVAETKFRTGEEQTAMTAGAGARQQTATTARPDPRAKFEAKGGVAGDITQVVGGATDKPIPPPPKKIEPKGATPGEIGHTGSLLEAKRRAQQKMRQDEQQGG